MPTEERSNEDWVEALRMPGPAQAAALDELRQRLQRNLFFYLSQERSDLRSLAEVELQEMAQDLAQDATLRILSNLEAFRGESRFTTWANKIAIRLAISDLRRSRYKDFSLEQLSADGDFALQTSSAQLVSAAPPNPETAAERENALGILESALREALTDKQYQALTAVTLNGVPMDVVAEQMGTNRNALYKLIHDARKKLRQHLEAQGLSTDYLLNLFQ